MLTIHLITHNNEKTIQRTLESVKPLEGELFVTDLGSEDKTQDICRSDGAKVFYASFQDSRADLRNRMVGHSSFEWQLMLHPWEAIGGTQALSAAMQQDKACSLMVVKGDMVTKETRLWKKSSGLTFVNPIYERLSTSDTFQSGALVYSEGSTENVFDLVKRWRDSHPADNEAIYCESCEHLIRQDWEGFLSCAERFLFADRRPEMAPVMMKCYLAVVLCHVKKDATRAVRHILEALAVRPLMAEFWCCLADIHYWLIRDYHKAEKFYKNAIDLGKHRPTDDSWPVQLSKYKDYPQQMIDSCQKLEKTTTYVIRPVRKQLP